MRWRWKVAKLLAAQVCSRRLRRRLWGRRPRGWAAVRAANRRHHAAICGVNCGGVGHHRVGDLFLADDGDGAGARGRVGGGVVEEQHERAGQPV